MKLGKISFFFSLIFINFYCLLHAEQKIIVVPLVNLENLKPSFEKEETDLPDATKKENLILKEKKVKATKNKSTRVNIVALDKITAKTSNIGLLLGETKKFGLLEIKALKCGNVKSPKESQQELGQAAYIQVKDLSDNLSNKVFVFNGWTFSSGTTLNPLDHPVYDLWLVDCDNV